MRSLLILGLIGLVSCSSTQKTGDQQTDAVLSHLQKGKTFIGGQDFDEKFKRDGFINGDYLMISSVIENEYGNEVKMRKLGEAESMSRLLQSAPTDYKGAIQRAISSMDEDNGSFSASSIAVTEVKALTGLKSNFDDFQCRTYAIPTADLKFKISKECRTIMRVPASNLMKSFKITLDKKYGIKDDELIEVLKKDLLGEEPKAVTQN